MPHFEPGDYISAHKMLHVENIRLVMSLRQLYLQYFSFSLPDGEFMLGYMRHVVAVLYMGKGLINGGRGWYLSNPTVQ